MEQAELTGIQVLLTRHHEGRVMLSLAVVERDKTWGDASPPPAFGQQRFAYAIHDQLGRFKVHSVVGHSGQAQNLGCARLHTPANSAWMRAPGSRCPDGGMGIRKTSPE